MSCSEEAVWNHSRWRKAGEQLQDILERWESGHEYKSERLVPRAEKVNCFCHVNCKTRWCEDALLLKPQMKYKYRNTHTRSFTNVRPPPSVSEPPLQPSATIYNLLMQNYICKVYFSKRNKVKHIMFWLMPTWLFTFIPTRKPLTGFLISSVPSKILIINNLGSNM